MSKKKKEEKRPAVALSSDDAGELGMIMDRLAVQSPDGETFDNWLRSLRNTLKGRGSLTVALIEALGRTPSEASFRAFTMLRDLPEGGTGVRVIKQTAYRFAQRGYTLPPESSEKEVALVASETRKSIAYMVMEDEPCFLVSALVHSIDEPEPLALVAYFVDDFDRLHLDLSPSSSKRFKGFIRNTGRSSPSSLCEIPIRHAARLVLEMIGWSRGERPVVSGAVERLLRPFHEPEQPPYGYEVMGGEPEAVIRPSEIDVRALSDVLPVRWLGFSAENLKPWREAILAAQGSVLVIPEEMKYDRVKGLIRKAADDLCVGAHRSFAQRFLEEGALYLRLTGRRAEASSAWAAAQQLAGGGEAGDNPLVFQLVAASLKKHWPDDFTTDPEADETPDGPSGFYDTTDSGLIIPR